MTKTIKPITPFQRRMRIAFGLALSVLFSTIAVSILIISKLDESLDWVSHTHQVVASVNATHVQFTSARISGKNYLITRQPKYLAIRELAIASFNEQLSKVKVATADNDRQQDNVKLLMLLSDSLFTAASSYNQTIEKSRVSEPEAIELTDKLEFMASKVISQFQIMRDEEGRLLVERQKLSSNFAYQAYSIMPTMFIVQLILTFYIYNSVLDECSLWISED